MAAGHSSGWPIVQAGAQTLTDALAYHLKSLGGWIETCSRSGCSFPATDFTLADITPRQLLQIAGSALPSAYRRKLERFRYGAGAFKIDYALNSPIPWKAKECSRAATVHLGGKLEELAASERHFTSRAPIRPACPALAVRSIPRSGRPPHCLGLLPRPQRQRPGLCETDRSSDRAIRSGFWRLYCRAGCLPARCARTLESKSDRRRSVRRGHGSPPALLSPRFLALSNAGARALSSAAPRRLPEAAFMACAASTLPGLQSGTCRVSERPSQPRFRSGKGAESSRIQP